MLNTDYYVNIYFSKRFCLLYLVQIMDILLSYLLINLNVDKMQTEVEHEYSKKKKKKKIGYHITFFRLEEIARKIISRHFIHESYKKPLKRSSILA